MEWPPSSPIKLPIWPLWKASSMPATKRLTHCYNTRIMVVMRMLYRHTTIYSSSSHMLKSAAKRPIIHTHANKLHAREHDIEQYEHEKKKKKGEKSYALEHRGCLTNCSWRGSQISSAFPWFKLLAGPVKHNRGLTYYQSTLPLTNLHKKKRTKKVPHRVGLV